MQIVSGQLVGTLFDLESSTKLLKELQEQKQGKQGEVAARTGLSLDCMCPDHTFMHWANCCRKKSGACCLPVPAVEGA